VVPPQHRSSEGSPEVTGHSKRLQPASLGDRRKYFNSLKFPKSYARQLAESVERARKVYLQYMEGVSRAWQSHQRCVEEDITLVNSSAPEARTERRAIGLPPFGRKNFQANHVARAAPEKAPSRMISSEAVLAPPSKSRSAAAPPKKEPSSALASMQKVRIFHDGQSSEKAHYRYRNAANMREARLPKVRLPLIHLADVYIRHSRVR